MMRMDSTNRIGDSTEIEVRSAATVDIPGSEMDAFKPRIDEVLLQVDQLEQKVQEIERFYSDNNKRSLNNSKASSILKDKEKLRNINSIKNQQDDATNIAGCPSKRMLELLRQFNTILRQITAHKWAWPFMEPVDVKGLGLHDYNEIIEKPMDFGTIKKQLVEAKDGCAYKHVREACADVRLVFKNAMKYNEEKHDIHVMAKSLLAKFEDKWLQLLPKVIEEEKRLEEEEAEAQLRTHLAQEAVYANMARSTNDELLEMDADLEELRELVVQNCRKMSTEEKRQLGTGLARLSPEDLSKALEIVAQANPSFVATAEEVDLDIDAQSETTLWRLKFFVKNALQAQGKASGSVGGNENDNNKNNNMKRKREISDALVRTAKKRSKKGGGGGGGAP